MTTLENKVTTQHLQRSAYLYVRQSTLRQVLENTESTQRQYALKDKRWRWMERSQVVVIDCDLGQSGPPPQTGGLSTAVRKWAWAGPALSWLGGLRLARNSADWHRLLEICALTQTSSWMKTGV